MAGKGGGAWKVAYADFVTAMMAFFLVMWIVGQGKDVREAIVEYFRDPYGVKSKTPGATVGGFRKGRGDALASRMVDGGGRSGRGSSEGGRKNKPGKVSAVRDPSLFVLNDGGKRSVGGMIEFREASAELSEDAKAELTKLAPALRGKINKLEIRGHTTNRPLPADSPFASAWDLCYARCQATMKCLTDAGVEPDRIRLSQAAGYEPQTILEEPGKQEKNARVEIRMLNEFVEDLMGTKEERAKKFGESEPAAAEPEEEPAEK